VVIVGCWNYPLDINGITCTGNNAAPAAAKSTSNNILTKTSSFF